MNIERTDSQQTSCSASVVMDGKPVQVAAASVNIRPGRSMNVSITVMEGMDKLDEAVREEIGAMFRGYLADELTKAAGLGIPVAPPEQ